jgi:ABC-2 type transport system ATP-binding protein
MSAAAVPSRVAVAAAADAPVLEASGLSFNYGERQALRDVSFAIGRGEIFGFLGPNGGGKTTLFKILSTLVPSQRGSVRVLGHDLQSEAHAIRPRLGVVFQHPSLDGKLTVAENLAHHGHLYGIAGRKLCERSIAMMERMGITARADDLAETLSGGLQRRAELAKALLHEPELLLLDEPSTGLDPGARREFNDYLAVLRERDGVAIVLTTHYMEEAERCDRIGVMHRGELVAIGPPAELKAAIGGEVIVIHAHAAEALKQKLEQRFGLSGAVVGATIRIERPRAYELVAAMVEAFGDDIESVSVGKPTLEDVFVHLTGHQFFFAEPRPAPQPD